MYTEDELVLISGLQHLAFCPRQCALIHIENIWAENFLTAEGRVLHEKAHEPGDECIGDIKIVRGLRLRSLTLGVTGTADVVEFHSDENGVEIAGSSGKWVPYPVEYKRGKPKPNECDMVQLCAQAICLEEMLEVSVLEGAIFYGQPRRRQEVSFDVVLRKLTEDYCKRFHELVNIGKTPLAEFSEKCKACSLEAFCLPNTVGARKSVSKYLGQMLSPDEKTLDK